MDIDWRTVPFNHNWEKNQPSLMNPGSKITFPQFVMEMVIWLRRQYWNNYKHINLGPNWSNQIQREVRQLVQQATVICNHFEHPQKEALIIYAFKKYFRERKPTSIGTFRKTRVTINKKTGRENLNVSQAEKDVILGIQAELDKAIKTRDIFKNSSPAVIAEQSEKSTATSPKKENKNKKLTGIANLLKIEQDLLKNKDIQHDI